MGLPTLPVLASRGCARRCSFCSIHTFYRTAPGKIVRVRKPEKVIEEMLDLNAGCPSSTSGRSPVVVVPAALNMDLGHCLVKSETRSAQLRGRRYGVL